MESNNSHAESRLSTPLRWRIALSLCSAGCSLLQVRAPPQVAPQWPAQMQCTRASTAPTADLVSVGVLAAIATASLVSASGRQCPGNFTQDFFGCAEKSIDTAVGIGAAMGAGLGALSAAYGYSSVARCRDESEARVVANWAPSPPWDSRVSASPLSLASAQQYCRGRKLSLPSREEVASLARQQMPVVVWTSSTSDAHSGPDDPAMPQPVAVDLATGVGDRRAADEELRALCITR